MARLKNAKGIEIVTSNAVEIVRLRASGYGLVDETPSAQSDEAPSDDQGGQQPQVEQVTADAGADEDADAGTTVSDKSDTKSDTKARGRGSRS